MRRIIACVLFAVIASIGQTSSPANDLTSILMNLNNSRSPRTTINRQFIAKVMSMAEKSGQPSRSDVAAFADELTGALNNRTFSADQIEPVSEAVVEVLHSSGTGTSLLRESMNGAAKALVKVGVSQARSSAISSRLADIGKSVRGPEDIPVKHDLK